MLHGALCRHKDTYIFIWLPLELSHGAKPCARQCRRALINLFAREGRTGTGKEAQYETSCGGVCCSPAAQVALTQDRGRAAVHLIGQIFAVLNSLEH